MDQAKTILPRVKALSNTQFQKGGSSVRKSSPGWRYDLFPDGGCAELVDAASKLGFLPRRLVIQADNAVKETKNTFTLAGA
eukprot:1497875-Pyramimonas_sp.AAC.1